MRSSRGLPIPRWRLALKDPLGFRVGARGKHVPKFGRHFAHSRPVWPGIDRIRAESPQCSAEFDKCGAEFAQKRSGPARVRQDLAGIWTAQDWPAQIGDWLNVYPCQGTWVETRQTRPSLRNLRQHSSEHCRLCSLKLSDVLDRSAPDLATQRALLSISQGRGPRFSRTQTAGCSDMPVIGCGSDMRRKAHTARQSYDVGAGLRPRRHLIMPIGNDFAEYLPLPLCRPFCVLGETEAEPRLVCFGAWLEHHLSTRWRGEKGARICDCCHMAT